MTLNVINFCNFLETTILEDDSNGIPVNEIKNLYNHVSFRNKLDHTINNNYLVILLEVYCICKNFKYHITSTGGLKKIRGITWANPSVKEYAGILTNGLPNSANADEKISNLHKSIFGGVTLAAA